MIQRLIAMNTGMALSFWWSDRQLRGRLRQVIKKSKKEENGRWKPGYGGQEKV